MNRNSYSDAAADTVAETLRRFGGRVASQRLSHNIAQARLAQDAGVSVSSVKRLEAGGNSSLDTLLRVLQVLGLADRFTDMLPQADVRPVERVQHGGHERQRASDRAPAAKASDWAWGEDDA